MKLRRQSQFFPQATQRRRGMTLLEMMITMGVMAVVIGGVLSANFLGMREERLMESKAGASDTARRSVNQMLYDIRAAKGFDIGTLTGTNFIAITNGTIQGAALKLYCIAISTNSVIDPNRYIMYYYDNSQSASFNGMLWRINSTNGTAAVMVSNLINTLYFTSENYTGQIQSVRTYKAIIHTTLQFSQFQYPLTPVGTNGLFDYYRIDCRATLHIPDGQ
jgi:prepilin-type N-terminal cleavage/methylation domain-containing protein